MKELIRVRVQYASRQQCCKTHKRSLLTFNKRNELSPNHHAKQNVLSVCPHSFVCNSASEIAWEELVLYEWTMQAVQHCGDLKGHKSTTRLDIDLKILNIVFRNIAAFQSWKPYINVLLLFLGFVCYGTINICCSMERCGFLQRKFVFLFLIIKRCSDENSFLNFAWLYNCFHIFISVVVSVCTKHKDRLFFTVVPCILILSKSFIYQLMHNRVALK